MELLICHENTDPFEYNDDMLLRLFRYDIPFIERKSFEFLMPFFHGFKSCEEDNHSSIRRIQAGLDVGGCIVELML